MMSDVSISIDTDNDNDNEDDNEDGFLKINSSPRSDVGDDGDVVNTLETYPITPSCPPQSCIQKSEGLRSYSLFSMLSDSVIFNRAEKYNISVSKDVSLIVRFMLNNDPESINSIERCLDDIIQDDVIDINDIPQFICILRELYEMLSTFNRKKALKSFTGHKCVIISGEILKLIVTLMVRRGKFKQLYLKSASAAQRDNDVFIDKKQSDLIKVSEKIIDTCIRLILIPIDTNCSDTAVLKRMFSCCC